MSLNCENPINLSLAPANNNGYSGGMGWGGDWSAWIILFLIFGMFGWGGFGYGGFGGGYGGGSGLQGMATRADINEGFALNNLQGGINSIQQGICDSTYALNNTITNGFNNTNVALMQGQNALSTQLANCCCENRQGQADIKYQMATDTCAIQNTIQNTTRDIIDNQNCNSRAILDFLTQDKISSLQNEVQSLRLAASQSNQNAVLMAAMDANKAEILRRTGNDCPTAAYIVQPPTPVTFPTNCCGTVNFANNGCGNNTACGF